ncbi:MAG: SRPBCC domain-containing protein [Bacteroidetes bacterium]|nr:MAG: SRPBCC domain-containing protein [Bacteroidota bacterium]
MKTTDQPIIVEQLFNKSVIEVWRAVTEQDKMVQWFFKDIPEFKAEVGFKVQFNVKAPSRDFLHHWTITEVIPQQKIVYNWKYKDFKGDSYVTFELFEIENQTKLVLTAKVLEDFDDSIIEFKRESGVAGWNYFIKDSLVTFLNN